MAITQLANDVIMVLNGETLVALFSIALTTCKSKLAEYCINAEFLTSSIAII